MQEITEKNHFIFHTEDQKNLPSLGRYSDVPQVNNRLLGKYFGYLSGIYPRIYLPTQKYGYLFFFKKEQTVVIIYSDKQYDCDNVSSIKKKKKRLPRPKDQK